MTSGANMQGETYPVSLTCCGRVNSKLKRVTFSSAGSFSLCGDKKDDYHVTFTSHGRVLGR